MEKFLVEFLEVFPMGILMKFLEVILKNLEGFLGVMDKVLKRYLVKYLEESLEK